MNYIEDLIKMTQQLCNTLDQMAENERKFGHELCHRLEQISYDFFKSESDLKSIQHFMIGEGYGTAIE